MSVLWEHPGDHTARDIVQLMPDYAYTTIATVLDRLTVKDLTTRRKIGRSFRYAATDNRAIHTAVLMHEALESTADPEAALACFVSRATTEQVAALRAALSD